MLLPRSSLGWLLYILFPLSNTALNIFLTLKNIETAFKQIRLYTIAFALLCAGVCGYALYASYSFAQKQREKIYVLDEGKSLMLALSQDASRNRPVEAREHVRRFHELFFTIAPDKEAIEGNMQRAFLLCDKSASEEQAQAEMGRLSDYFADATPTPEVQQAQQASSAKIEGSLQRYEENNRLLSSFYAPDPHEEEREALRAEIDDLREELRRKDSEDEDDEEKQLALMEKSYQMAAKYLPKGTNLPANAFSEATERPIAEPQDKSKVATAGEPMLETLTEQKSIVSSLAQPMSDSAFIQEYGARERHLGFHSINKGAISLQRNTLRVVVDRTTTLQEGEYVALRLLETARIKDLRIPRGGKLIAGAKIEGNRMQLLIKSIEVGGQITPVKLSAYDTDGQEGIYIPGSENVSALKEMGANIGGSMGTSFTFASSAKDQIISEAARGVMQGASQLLQKKLRTIKVTLKGGYRLFLVQTK